MDMRFYWLLLVFIFFGRGISCQSIYFERPYNAQTSLSAQIAIPVVGSNTRLLALGEETESLNFPIDTIAQMIIAESGTNTSDGIDGLAFAFGAVSDFGHAIEPLIGVQALAGICLNPNMALRGLVWVNLQEK